MFICQILNRFFQPSKDSGNLYHKTIDTHDVISEGLVLINRLVNHSSVLSIFFIFRLIVLKMGWFGMLMSDSAYVLWLLRILCLSTKNVLEQKKLTLDIELGTEGINKQILI